MHTRTCFHSQALKRIPLVLLVIAFAGLFACRVRETEPPPETTTPKGVELPFEIIEQCQLGCGALWPLDAPGLIVVPGLYSLWQIEDLVSDEAGESLRALDYDRYFAVAVFVDVRAHREHITIERVLRRGDTVVIDARMGGMAAHEGIITPHHLVKVGKEEDWEHEIPFELRVDGEKAPSAVDFIP